MKLSRLFAAAVALSLWSGAAFADVTATWQNRKEMALHLGGAFELENGAGNVEIIGTDEPKFTLLATYIVKAENAAALEEGKRMLNVHIIGTNRAISARTVGAVRNSAWSSTVHYSISLPRTAHVKVTSGATQKLRIVNIIGNVTVKSFSGTLTLEKISGATTAENTNGTIIFDPREGLDANVQLSTINGNIIVSVAPDANFEWNAETIKGDFRTTLPGVRARFTDVNSLRAGVNAPGGPTLTTIALMGNVFLLRKGSRHQDSTSVRTGLDIPPPQQQNTGLPTYRYDQIQGQFIYSTTLGHIYIREVRGNANVATGAGEVRVGSVIGGAHVNSMGGPLMLGNVLGSVQAHTEAGDVLVNAAREGGTITTGGGIIRLLYTGGPTRLQSGGGDIFVRQAAAPISAETKSGDINITVQPTAKTMKVTAKTQNGSILLNLAPKFAADIDATVTTSDAANTIVSEIPGLQIRREQVGTKTRWRATGKLNGGGEKIELTADEGGILITTRAGNPMTVITPQ
jgi:DUF4097 and DUF4098 domain-containing protein YvlB